MATQTADIREISQRIKERAEKLGALLFGDFTLTSGAKSSYYFDGRLLSLDPEGADLISAAFLRLAREAGARAVGGPVVAAVPIAGAVALRSRLEESRGGSPMPGFFVRDEAKGHGAGKRVEGPLQPGQPVAVFDDTVSTGGSLLSAVDAVQEMGCEVTIVMTVLDRQQGGSDEVRRRGIKFRALLEADAQGNINVVS
ncbi:MAG: orotate phosphoribosyltransferase [Chloroflexota bacterium]